MFYSGYLFLLPVKLLLLLLGLSFLYRYSKRSSKPLNLDYFIGFITLFSGAVICLSLVLILMGMYDFMVLLIIISVFMVSRIFDFTSKAAFKSRIKTIRINLTYFIIRNFEIKKTIHHKKPLSKSRVSSNKILLPIGFALLTGLTIFFFTALNLSADNFTLSENWYRDLFRIQQISQPVKWEVFNFPDTGEYILLSLYSLFSGLPAYMALYTAGIIQISLLSAVVFWMVSHLTGKNYYLGILSGIMFGGFYFMLPIDTSLLPEHKTIFSVMILALPAILISVRPELIRLHKKKVYYGLIPVFTALFFIDLKLTLFIIGPLLLISCILYPEGNRRFSLHSFPYYLLALGIGSLLFYLAGLSVGKNFFALLQASFSPTPFSTSSPHLLIPEGLLNNLYLLLCIIGLLPGILLYRVDRIRYALPLSFLIFGMFIFAIPHVFPAADPGLVRQVSILFMPLLFAIALFIFYEIFQRLFLEDYSFKPLRPLSLIPAISGLLYSGLLSSFPTEENINPENKDILRAYHTIDSQWLPQTYVVVNSLDNEIISNGRHDFMSYRVFMNHFGRSGLTRQPEAGSLKDSLFPKTFVFIYENEALKDMASELNPQFQGQVFNKLSELNNKQLDVQLFFSTPRLKVYCIQNDNQSGKINELFTTHLK